MASGGPDWGKISAIFGIVASLGGVIGVACSADVQRCTGIGGQYRGHFFRALRHCTDERNPYASASTASVANPAATTPSVSALSGDASSTDPRQLAGTRWVFYTGDVKTYATFNADGTITFSDPSYGSGGVWELAGSRGVAFHTDTYNFGATIGRGVPDSFAVSYRHLPRGSEVEPDLTATFTRVDIGSPSRDSETTR